LSSTHSGSGIANINAHCPINLATSIIDIDEYLVLAQCLSGVYPMLTCVWYSH
jgi:hypothetical protein